MVYRHLTWNEIRPDSFLGSRHHASYAGAAITFFGVIRDNAYGKAVHYLTYEAYDSLAENMIEDLIAKALRIWPILEAHVHHRLGRLKVGDIAVAIAVQSEHRLEAYKASQFLIDEIKQKVPIWKKEYFRDGTSEWGHCSSIPMEKVFS